MLHRIVGFTVVASLVVLAGCRSAPIHDVVAAPVVTTKPVTMEAVQSAIVVAGTGLGWRMEAGKQGTITGVLELRDHKAVVEVTYDTKAYNIKYKDSSNLDYSGTSIHKNYNGWVENLDKAIRAQLARS
jgi:PBP1b-binding outer membrane lipoprotein LpoB